MTTSFTRRLWIIAAVLLLLQGGAFFLLQRAKSSDVRPLRKDLDQFPYDLGDWHGEDQELDEDDCQEGRSSPQHQSQLPGCCIGTRGHVAHRRLGQSENAHVAPPSDVSVIRPPVPRSCGVRPIEVDDADPFQAELLLVEREGGRSLVLYWYRWDSQICTTRTQACMARLKMIGSHEWPPVVKVLLDTPCIPSETAALESLRNFAAEVRTWTRDL